MNKLTRKLFIFAMAMLMLVESPAMCVTAAEMEEKTEVVVLEVTEMESESSCNMNARTMLSACQIMVMPTSSGMFVEFHTDTVGTASIIGVKDIKIQRKVWWGWSNVATSEGGSAENVSSYACNLLYTGVGEGVTYRICCTHFGDTGEYEEVYNVTDPFKYIYEEPETEESTSN